MAKLRERQSTTSYGGNTFLLRDEEIDGIHVRGISHKEPPGKFGNDSAMFEEYIFLTKRFSQGVEAKEYRDTIREFLSVNQDTLSRFRDILDDITRLLDDHGRIIVGFETSPQEFAKGLYQLRIGQERLNENFRELGVALTEAKRDQLSLIYFGPELYVYGGLDPDIPIGQVRIVPLDSSELREETGNIFKDEAAYLQEQFQSEDGPDDNAIEKRLREDKIKIYEMADQRSVFMADKLKQLRRERRHIPIIASVGFAHFEIVVDELRRSPSTWYLPDGEDPRGPLRPISSSPTSTSFEPTGGWGFLGAVLGPFLEKLEDKSR